MAERKLPENRSRCAAAAGRRALPECAAPGRSLGQPWLRELAALALVVGLALATAAGAWAAEPKLPELTGRIVDEAGLVTAADRQTIEAMLVALEGKSTDQIAVVTLRSLQDYPIEDFANRLSRKWGIGQAGKNNGILLLVAPNERKVRIEVGRGLEPIMTDLLSGLIINNAILPAFRRGDVSGGIRDGVRDIRDVLLGDAAEVEKRARGGRKGPGPDYAAMIFLAIWIAIVVFVIYAHIRQARLQPGTIGQRRRRDRLGSDDIIVLPGGWGGGSGHWSGGSGGGGWSGGGGDFGGGGASGGW